MKPPTHAAMARHFRLRAIAHRPDAEHSAANPLMHPKVCAVFAAHHLALAILADHEAECEEDAMAKEAAPRASAAE